VIKTGCRQNQDGVVITFLTRRKLHEDFGGLQNLVFRDADFTTSDELQFD